MDDKLRDAIKLVLFELELFYGEPNCVCGCACAEHVPVTHDAKPSVPCRGCLCSNYRAPETLND